MWQETTLHKNILAGEGSVRTRNQLLPLSVEKFFLGDIATQMKAYRGHSSSYNSGLCGLHHQVLELLEAVLTGINGYAIIIRRQCHCSSALCLFKGFITTHRR